MSTLPSTTIAEAAGLYSFSRSLGSSTGISIVSTLVSRETQINWKIYGANISPQNPNLAYWLQRAHLPTLHSPKALVLLTKTLATQTSMNAFNDAYWFICCTFLGLLPLIFLFKQARLQNKH
jgi:DHA2 family multidrug resistance protein